MNNPYIPGTCWYGMKSSKVNTASRRIGEGPVVPCGTQGSPEYLVSKKIDGMTDGVSYRIFLCNVHVRRMKENGYTVQKIA